MNAPVRERRSLASRAMRPVARVVSAFVEPAFYWLGLLDANGHPDNAKTVYTVASFAADVMVVIQGVQLVLTKQDITWPFVGLVCVVLLFAAGVRYLLKALRFRFPDAPAQDTTESPVPGTSPAAGPGGGA